MSISLSFFNQGLANYKLFCDFFTGVWPTTKQFCDFCRKKTSLWYFLSVVFSVFNRPGVAGAVLQSPPWLINALSLVMVCGNIFKVPSIPNHKSWGAEIFERTFTPHHVSHVTCPMSRVRCHMSLFYCGAFRGRVCYQRGLPRLVFEAFPYWRGGISASGSATEDCKRSKWGRI